MLWHFGAKRDASAAPQPPSTTEVLTWGAGVFGQLGHGAQKDEAAPTVVQSLQSMPIAEVAAGGVATAVVTMDGRLLTFGSGQDSRLGHGYSISFPNEVIPRLVERLQGEAVRHVSVGGAHMACVTETGRVYTWGASFAGQLGHDNTERGFPNVVGGALQSLPVTQVACGRKHTVAVTADGRVFAWGGNREGAVGVGRDQRVVRAPAQVPGLADVVSVACGSDTTLALTRDGKLYSFGDDSYGALGHGQASKYQATPKLVTALAGERVVAIAAGEYHSLALTDTGLVYSWGCSSDGQTGHGVRAVTETQPKVVETLRPETVVHVAAGGGHSACLSAAGIVYMWGRGRSGQLGRGDQLESVAAYRTLPVSVAAFQDKHVQSLALGGDHSVALVRRTPEEAEAERRAQAQRAKEAQVAQDAEARRARVRMEREAREREAQTRREQLARERTRLREQERA